VGQLEAVVDSPWGVHLVRVAAEQALVALFLREDGLAWAGLMQRVVLLPQADVSVPVASKV
jgi:hypothetical protein